eukprot:11667768-Alexandrium_andersonii.AAC.1
MASASRSLPSSSGAISACRTCISSSTSSVLSSGYTGSPTIDTPSERYLVSSCGPTPSNPSGTSASAGPRG